ncbi:MAG: sensor histidine kinase [Myxococcota bacterium]
MADTILREQLARKELVQRLINTQEDERLRISRELHDRTGQTLSSIKMAIKSIEASITDVNIQNKFNEFVGILNSILDDIHSLSMELRNPILTDFGLLVALEEEIKILSITYSNIRFFLYADKDLTNKRFSKEIEVQMFRIFQEATRNAIRHSSARQIEVILKKEANDCLLMEISDDGRGMKVESDRRGIGIFGMKERAEIIRGNFRIMSEADRGTRVIVTVPIAP